MVTTKQRGQPIKGNSARLGHLHIRVEMPSKSRWVRAAQRSGSGLSDWVIRHLDRAAEAELPPGGPS